MKLPKRIILLVTSSQYARNRRPLVSNQLISMLMMMKRPSTMMKRMRALLATIEEACTQFKQLSNTKINKTIGTYK